MKTADLQKWLGDRDDQDQAKNRSFEGCIALRPGLSFSRYITGQDAPPCPRRRSKRNPTGPDFEEHWRRGCCWHRRERRRHLALCQEKRLDLRHKVEALTSPNYGISGDTT